MSRTSLSRREAMFGMFGTVVLAGCGKEYVRGSQDPSIDNAAMSTGLDKDDI